MSIERTERTNAQDAQESRDTLFLLGGAAMVVFGAGLILSTPVVRRFLGGVNAGGVLQAALPDFDRYMKLRSM
jgi:hypothetical protein